MSESIWIDRAQSAEARLKTLKDAYEPALVRIKNFKANFGIKEGDNGEIRIDFVKFVKNLGEAGAMELRNVIDEEYGRVRRVS